MIQPTRFLDVFQPFKNSFHFYWSIQVNCLLKAILSQKTNFQFFRNIKTRYSHTHTPACAPCIFWSSDFYLHFSSFLLSACTFFSWLDPKFLQKLHFLLGSTFYDLYLHCCSCSVTQLCPALSDPTDFSMPGLPVRHHLPKFAQVHVHHFRDAMQPSHPLIPSSPALNISQHQGLFQCQLFASDDQNTGVSASASVRLTSIQD